MRRKDQLCCRLEREQVLLGPSEISVSRGLECVLLQGLGIAVIATRITNMD